MLYARNCWYVAGWSYQVETGQPFPMQILGDRLVLFRTSSGQMVALEDRCVHRLAPLSLGRCEGEGLRCMYHGMLFDAAGTVIEIPGQSLIPPNAKVRSYPVVERDSWIWVWMGDAAAADEAAIPRSRSLDDPDYILRHGWLDYDAEAQLINDNLLDFSHLSFVHANSFNLGADPAATQAKVTQLENGIRYARWMEGLPTNGAGLPDTPADSFMGYDFLIPGVLVMNISSWPLGTAAKLDYAEPADHSRAFRDCTFSGQAVTPMADRKARYFFSIGPHRNQGDETIADLMFKMVETAFDEDKRMIEAQQKVIDETPDMRIMPTAHDRTVTMFNAKVARLARGDAQARESALA
ncbi:vanillate O-demethylase monooxygenase subunit [Novosphingobium chloroacetimidivorans]|uniref:Vanillate O-demethylase monooxygenase subunit n=1 Tax=Novosphingobium chloroacetimidivorans TaxID=1428314 RepID=A0A7W7NWP5_9SPHN|nr:aromatic ring-hydroxylating dioxygenase subunit alpha [Novosphingobium chloroacetimidivorans]MBB4858634.1 vanillate O-demethylase monooxygenase subunit [Novosphingobium chloroacetimidivorans]